MATIHYAIVDGAIEAELIDFLKEANSPHCSLYAEPVQPDLIALAPYLVVVTDKVQSWLNGKKTPWGIFLKSDLSLRELQQHFRNYLWVMIPEQNKPVLMRFYDPRNIWALTKVLTPRQLSDFIMPVTQVSTCYDGKYYEDSFSTAKKNQDSNIITTPFSQLTLTYRQYNLLEQQAQENYLDRLSVFINDNSEETELIISPGGISPRDLAEEYFLFCQSLNIIDDRSVRIMTILLLAQNISDTRDIPESWHEQLSDQAYPEHVRVLELALKELGFIPQ